MRLLCFALLLLEAPSAWSAPRIALQVDTPASAGGDWQTVLTAELTRLAPGVELVERVELARLWREREQAASVGAASAATLAPLAVDRYLHFRRVGPARWIVELIDAATGRALGSFAVEAADLASAPRLAEAAVRLLDAPAPRDPSATAPRVAVVESADSAGDVALFTLAARLRAALADEGLVLLDRSLTQEIAIEQNDATRGFRAAASSTSASATLLGLDAYLELSSREARLVRVRDGVVLDVRPRAEPDSNEVNSLQRWALPLLDRPASAFTDYLPQVEVEALEPFYRGLAHHDAGRFPEAVAEFTRAYELNGRFREAYEWSARCHEALGLTEVAAAIRRFLATEFLENLAASTGRLAPVDGLAFLGVGGPGLAPAARDALAAAIASHLARRDELGLRLPAELARLQTEFDWARLGAAPGGAAPAPALFTRHVLSVESRPQTETLELRFTLRDALGLLPLQTRVLPLPAGLARRDEALSGFLSAWPAGAHLTVDAPTNDRAPSPAPPIGTSPEIIAVLASAVTSTASESAADAGRLRLLLAHPGHPAAIVRRSASADEPLTSFIEHGRRADAIRRLPPGSVDRRWFELLRAFEHLDPLGPGSLYSDERIDARAELARLAVDDHDGPGLVARYHLLYFSQALRPAASVAAEAESLRERLRAPPDRLADCATSFDAALAALARLGRLASAPGPEDLADLDKFASPTDLPVFNFTPEGRLFCEVKTYAMTRHTFAGLSPQEAAANARTLLALNGRERPRGTYTPALLAAHPRSPALTQQIILDLGHVLRGEILPAGTSGDWEGRKALARAGLAYALDHIEHAFSVQTDTRALNNTNLLGAALLGILARPRLVEWLPDGTHAAAHARLGAAEAAARARLEFPQLYNPNTLHIPALSPENVLAFERDKYRSHGIWVPDAASIRARLLGRESAFEDPAKESTRRSWWWLAARWETEGAFTATERAALLARPLDALLRGSATDPDDADLARRFELGLFFLQGRRHADSERVLAPLAELPVADNASRARRTHVANAAFRMAQLHQIAGRLPEAFASARRSLALADGHTLPFHTEDLSYVHLESDLSAQVLRLLAELRHDPARLSLPDRVGFVRVPTPNGDTPLLTVYYRLPPPALAGGPAPRVLVLCPVFNTDPLESLSGPGPWARFADTHNLALVAPRFQVSDRSDRADHLFTHPRFASGWSGDALLRAIDAIARRSPLDSGRLLLEGRVSGSGFATNFAAWRPDRVAAVALAHGNWGVANQARPELPPLSAHRHIRYWIGANRWDNHDAPRNSPRFSYLQDFAARLRSAGLSVEWAEFDVPSSTPSQEMEEAARAFLARNLSP